MAWTTEDEAQLTALKAMRTSGVRTATYGDKSVTYQSLGDINEAIATMEGQKAAEMMGTSVSYGRSTLASTSRD
jgi:hypothetical protein